jgi:ubiquinone/menaquinone biosynthesis C-methylase UbiE
MSAASGTRTADRQSRLARLYDDEILPAYSAHFASLLLRQVDFARVDIGAGARVLEVGCATGHLTRELGRRLGDDCHITAIEETSAFIPEARMKIEGDPEVRAPITFQAGTPTALPFESNAVDLMVSNLGVASCDDPAAACNEIARVLAHGAQAVITAPLRGTWGEFLDLFRDVLREGGKRDSLAALDGYLAGLPDGDAVAGWLERAGLSDVRVEIDRWEILFGSAREFFFAPLVELGPLPAWKQVTGRGDEMQDVFFFTKEAIDTYFKGRVFAISVVGAAVTGTKR